MADQIVMTVLGPIAPERLGTTITHEHLLINMTAYFQQPAEASLQAYVDAPIEMANLGLIRRNPLLNRDNCLLIDLDAAIEEIVEFRKLGGDTIVDVTLPDIGRDPLALQIASRMSGLNIVCGCGHYVHLAHPPSLDDESVEEVAERLIVELTDGIGTTGVRPGIIGEIGTSDPIRPNEEKTLRAAVRAQHATGVAITIHLHPPTRNGHEVVAILESEGADLSRVVLDHVDIYLGHLDATVADAVAYQRELAAYGCYLEYDCIGNEAYFAGAGYGKSFWCPSDKERAEALALLFEAGCGDHILLSQDVCHKYHLVRHGGFGYGHILRSFTHNLREVGLGDAELAQLLVENPRRVLAYTPAAAPSAVLSAPATSTAS